MSVYRTIDPLVLYTFWILFLAAMGEIHDLRIIMDSADKELKESKEKVKAREAVMMGLESKVCFTCRRLENEVYMYLMIIIVSFS